MSAPRIGCVSYLNARPLMYGLSAELATPSELAARFLEGRYDAALIPVYETLRLGHPLIAEGFGIGCTGPVNSVIVAHRKPLEETAEIVLDPASRTSANLLRVLLTKHYGLAPALVGHSRDPLAARLIIGDPAIDFQRTKTSGWQILDLGESWCRWTGLPFVFAVWTLSPQAPAETADLLRSAAFQGIENLEAIANDEADPAFALDYLRRSIHFPVGEFEKAGIRKFRELLISCGLLASDSPEPTFL